MPGLPETSQKQYTRTVLFSTVYDILSQVVWIKPSVRAAYRDQEDKVGASIISLYNKLTGSETTPRRSWCAIVRRC